MSDLWVISSSIIAILVIVGLILKLKVDPVIALVGVSIALALVNGLAPADAVQTVLLGFGDLMAEIGLLIVFGILSGALLTYLGAIQLLGAFLLKTFGKRLMPYAFGTTIGTVLSSIFVDVCLVITAPIARQVAPSLGKHGLARMATSIMIGVEVGLTMSIPGVAALALSGLLGVPVGTFILAGIPVAAATIISSIFIMTMLFKLGFWKPDLDEAKLAEKANKAKEREEELRGGGGVSASNGPRPTPGPQPYISDGSESSSTHSVVTLTEESEPVKSVPSAVMEASDADTYVDTDIELEKEKQPHFLVSFAPMLVALFLIIGGSCAGVFGLESPFIELFSDPTIALLIALVGLCSLVTMKASAKTTSTVVKKGFKNSGEILVLTGVGGCLAAVVQAIGVGDILLNYLSPGSFAPLLMVWLLAAVLHIAVGSVTTSAITAAGILAPVAASLGVAPVLVALAAGAGSMFVIHFTSNTFWMMQSLFGLTTRGALKACTFGVSVASVMGLVWVLVLSIFI
ncbi:GntP family permease [Corynebacterium lubricantis]|uniref:GntP family permease n=1 Tax=Corynebacterium lubricantis TaxID=541095 RepID=UPI00047784A8|nr:SLC13 family permease [Corynebacterium lubricantis]